MVIKNEKVISMEDLNVIENFFKYYKNGDGKLPDYLQKEVDTLASKGANYDAEDQYRLTIALCKALATENIPILNHIATKPIVEKCEQVFSDAELTEALEKALKQP